MLPKDAAPGDPPVRRGRADVPVRHPYWTPLRTTLRRLKEITGGQHARRDSGDAVPFKSLCLLADEGVG